ncbi:MAG: lipoate--protein ligase family protein [Anaerolineae bacterium]
MSYPAATWRLLSEPYPRPGPLNMAIDEAVLRAVAAGKAPPTLRLYAWSPPTLTLGRGQPYADADLAELRRHGVTLVRRMTGGTAVLNRDELSYMVAVTDQEPRFSAVNIVESYRGLSGAFLHALKMLGLTRARADGRGPQEPRRSSRAERTPVCFEIPLDYEVTVGERKLIGSAQMRVRGGILQHGSMPLTGDLGDISQFLVARPDPDRIRSLALTLYEALGQLVTWEEAAEAMVIGFQEALNLELVPSPLLPLERQRVEELVAEKYGNPSWTARV